MKYYKIFKDTEIESFILFHYSIGELCYLNENDKQTKELLENGNIGEIEEKELLNKLSENQENWIKLQNKMIRENANYIYSLHPSYIKIKEHLDEILIQQSNLHKLTIQEKKLSLMQMFDDIVRLSYESFNKIKTIRVSKTIKALLIASKHDSMLPYDNAILKSIKFSSCPENIDIEIKDTTKDNYSFDLIFEDNIEINNIKL